nr:ATPase, T2SS/T4P/T4SS family [Kineosporia sp. A_224]
MTAPALNYGLVRRLQAEVADRMTATKQQYEQQGVAALASADERQLALSFARDAVQRYMQEQIAAGQELPDGSYDVRLVEAIDAAMYGAGALQALLDDPGVENIDINGCDEVWVTRADGSKVRDRPVAATDEDLVDIVRNLGAYAGLNARPFTPATPELDLRLPDGSRLSAIMVASERPSISIRRNRFPQMFLDEIPPQARTTNSRNTGRGADDGSGSGAGRATTLVELGTVDEQLAAFLRAAVLARCNIMVAGATDSGKTTLLRALINCIPPHERLITVERALELGLRRHPELHPDVVEMEEVLGSPDSAGGTGGGVSIGQLVRRTRRQNPSRVIVGEVLGSEVVEMLSAMSQGNDGSLSTIHARDAADVFGRLATYAAQHEGLSFDVSHSLIGSTLDFVVFVRKNPRAGGRRAVMEVLEVTGSADGRVTRSRIFTEGQDGAAVRDIEIPISRLRKLEEAGYNDAPGWTHTSNTHASNGYGGNTYRADGYSGRGYADVGWSGGR